MRPLLLLLLLLAPASAAPRSPTRVSEVEISDRRRFERVARDALAIRIELSPDVAASAGLFDEAGRVPSFAPAHVAALVKRIEADLDALAGLKTRGWSMDEQIDLRWTYAQLLEARRRLVVERAWEHRPAEWLEPVTNTTLALLTYAPERADLRAAVTAGLPALMAEVRALTTHPTARDVTVARGLLDSLEGTVALDPPGPARDAATAAIAETRAWLDTLRDLPEFTVIGEANYAWRLKHALLLPWTPDELLALAEAELARVDAQIAALQPRVEEPPTLTPAQQAEAAALDQAGLLALYDGLVQDYVGRIKASGVLTVPDGMGPIRARPTPDALIPLTGDGGSMNQAPTFGGSNVGYWNVEHVHADWPQADREGTVLAFRYPDVSGIGPYAVHEGVPGHHLQLSIARLNPDPLRSVLMDNVMVEGWALYAEQLFWEAGGFGSTARAELNMLRSWRFRIRRVIYDVNVETGRWSLQQAADWKHDAPPGEGRIDEDLLRSINWPTQLICYFSGKMQILALRDRVKAAQGDAFSPRAFHDALLGEGSVPLVMARAKITGEPLPPLEPRSEW